MMASRADRRARESMLERGLRDREAGCGPQKYDPSLSSLVHELLFITQAAEWGSLHNPVESAYEVRNGRRESQAKASGDPHHASAWKRGRTCKRSPSY